MQLATRHLQLEGGCNFRDVGGLPTADGRTLCRGRVYRAGVLSYFTPNDARCLTELGVRTICDLRCADERAREPTRWPTPDVAMLDWADNDDAPSVTGRLAPRQRDSLSMRAAMLAMYRDLPRWMVPRLQGLFACLTHDRLPVVVHCSAGKDRTGFAVAVLLAMLGVDRDTIMQDYLYTNAVGNFEEFARRRSGAALGVTDDRHPLLRLPDDVRRVLLAADPDYLLAALQQIDSTYGSVESYVEQAVGLTAGQRAHIQEALLA